MKQILIIVAMAGLIFSCSDKKTTLEVNKLKGKVKSVRLSEEHAIQRSGEITHQKDPTKATYITESLFDKDGYETENNIFTDSGGVFLKTVMKYDDERNRIESETHNHDGDVTTIWKMTYEDDRQIEASNCDHLHETDKGLGLRRHSYYDRDDRLSKAVFSDCNGNEKQTLEYAYDDRGNLIEFRESFNGGLSKITKYKYNSEDEVIEEKTDDTIITYRYEHDKTGNWTVQYKFIGGKPDVANVRTIEYY